MLTEKTKKYFTNLEKDVNKIYSVAETAKAKELDPVNKVEIPLAKTMAKKCVELVATLYPQLSNSGADKRIIELEKKYGKLDSTIIFKIAEEVAKQRFCKFSSLLEAIDAGIRVGFSYITLGVVSSPIEGFTKLDIEKTREGKEYFKAYFSGPIRSAGTTASCLVLMLIDYLRELFGYAKYDPKEEEIKRYVTECYDYHDRITNLQYIGTEEELEFLAKNLPIQIAGEPTEKLEVSNYKNLERVETNNIRGGMCLIFSEGLAQKAAKGFRLLNTAKKNGINSTGFDFLEEYLKLHEKQTSGKSEDSTPVYIKDLVAGRPVFGHPSCSGGFRFRYGRGRVSGFSAASLHPATMVITDGFIATGTQLKIEKPTKGMVATVCDNIDGPIVKMFNGSVKKIKTGEEAKKFYPDVEEIIYLGDILFPFSDVANRNSQLPKPGYVEEWWDLELKEKNSNLRKDIDIFNVDLEKAIEISNNSNIPLHPNFIFYWTQITKEQFLGLMSWLKYAKFDKKIIFPYNSSDKEKFKEGKRALEILGIEHEAVIENIIINEENSKALLVNLGIDWKNLDRENLFKEKIEKLKEKINTELKNKEVLEIINFVSNFEIKDKAGDFIGARMGRPEKAKLRKLTGSPNVLFPVGKEGGRLRSVQAACEEGSVTSSFPIYYCKKCEKETIYPTCENCGEKCEKLFYCPECDKKSFHSCKEHSSSRNYCETKLDINYYFNKAVENLGLSKDEIPLLIKGIRGTSSENHVMENLEKGFLRALYNLQVNKDGTIRFDATELPLVCFKPKEVSVSVERLKQLGYEKDIFGNELKNENQILELMPHDVVLPSSSESLDERADNVFVKVAKFADDLLERFYKLKPFYNVKNRDDLIGHLGVCMAPHNCAGVICRFIGFSNTLGLLASPYMHAAIRRDCFDYDTYMLIKKNGLWRNIKIGEIVEELNPSEIVDEFGTKEKKVDGFETIGFDKKAKNVKINNFTKHKKQSMLQIKTALGKKIKVTENHKFLIDGKLRKAKDLEIGEMVPLPIKIDVPVKKQKEINLLEELKNEKIMVRDIGGVLKNLDKKEKQRILEKLNITKKQFMNYQLRNSYPISFVLKLNKDLRNEIYSKGKIAIKRDSVEVPILIKIDKELLEVIGLYIAEGYSRSLGGKKGLNQVYISARDKGIRKLIKRTVKKHFNLDPSENKKDRVTFSSKILYLFFNKVLNCGQDAMNKRIPSLFLNLSLDKLAAILRGYFEGDGSISAGDRRIICDSISEGLLSDLEFCLNRFGIFCKRYEYEKEPGQILKDFYIKKNRKIPKFKITKIIIGSDFVHNFSRIKFLSQRKNKILEYHLSKKSKGMRIKKDKFFVYDPIVSIKNMGEKESYCLNVNTGNHLVVANSILSKQCDGDEAAVMLLGDVLLNFSKSFLPNHRGGTQDAPLVLNSRIDAGEVDDQILDFEMTFEYPLELYKKAEQRKHSSEIDIPNVKSALREEKDPFVNLGFTHNTSNFNEGIVCSSYKLLSTMQEKVQHQMELVDKIRAADTSDTARLVLERHFIKDMKGNLRRFSTQNFRCVACNEILRRPPLTGVCPRCKGKIIFTVNEGGIKKYLGAALSLVDKYHLSTYIKQNIELTKRFIDSIFGKELEKQEKIEKWF